MPQVQTDLSLQAQCPSLLELVERPVGSDGDQRRGGLGGTGELLGLCRCERSPRAPRRIWRQCRCALEECRRRSDTAPRLRATGRTLELGGDRFIGPQRTPRAVPCPPVGVPLGVRGVGECAVHAMTVLVRRRSVCRRTDEWVNEADGRADIEQSCVHCGDRVGQLEPKDLSRAMQQEGIAERLCGGREDKQLRRRRERQKARGITLFDLACDLQASRKAESSGKVRDVPSARQLEQGEWIAAAFGDDPVAHRGVERDLQVGQQQRARIVGAETGHTQLGKADEDIRVADGARRANQCDPLGECPTPDEQEHLGRGDIEPLRVVDHAQQRWSSAASANKVNVARPTRNRSGAGPVCWPNTMRRASRCGTGSRST